MTIFGDPALLQVVKHFNPEIRPCGLLIQRLKTYLWPITSMPMANLGRTHRG
jgi:hypothetical protein